MYGSTATNLSHCSICGRNCGCNTATIYFYPAASTADWEEEKRRRELEEAERLWAFRQYSIDLGRDYSLREPPRPASYRGRQSTAFHWMAHRKRSFKMRANKPGWERGR